MSSEQVTITVGWDALETAVDAVILETLNGNFECRNLTTLVAECGGGCEDDMEFLRAAQAAGVDIDERLTQIRHLLGLTPR